jgi:hypothetical protein
MVNVLGKEVKVTSARKIAANRKNALRSTGPKSKQGKKRASRNALRHGLNVPLRRDPSAAAEVEALLVQLVSSLTERPTEGPDFALARRIAEAEVDIRRVRRVEQELITGLLADAQAQHSNPKALTTGLARNYPTLRVLERYERRSASHRRSAIRKFAAHRTAAP